ncbi:MAG: Tfp pilus assembly protein FimT/FimU [Pyrinomonadaceae bacterium]
MHKVNRKRQTSRRLSQRGFTMMQMIMTVAIIAIVTTFGVLGITGARAEMRVQNSARRFAVYVEKARADAVRRHAGAGSESSVQTFDPGTNTFAVTMDFDGSGIVRTRTFTLDSGVFFSTVGQTATFDWRGRVTERLAFQVSNGTKSIPVDISGSGDITVDDQIFADDAIPDVALTQVTGDLIPDPTPLPTATPTPEGVPNPDQTPTPTPTPPGNSGGSSGNGSPHSTPTPTPTPSPSLSPTPTPTPNPNGTPAPTPLPACSATVTSVSLTLSQSDSARRTGTVAYTLANGTGARTVSAVLSGGGNSLNISVSPSSVSGSGTVSVTIGAKSGNGNRGTFVVQISSSPGCGTTQQVTVTVGN